MKSSLSLTDTITPGLRAKIRAVKNAKPIVEALGLGLLSMTQDSFNNPSKRAAPWPNKIDGSPARLRKSQALFKAWHVGQATNKSVTVENDRPYAAIHQFGGRTKPHVIRPKTKQGLMFPGAPHPLKKVDHPGSRIPARPMLPFIPNSGGTPELAAWARARLEKVGQRAFEAHVGK